MKHITLYDKVTGDIIGTKSASSQAILDKQKIPERAAVYIGKIAEGKKINLTTKLPEESIVKKPIVYSAEVEAEIAKRKAHVLVSGTEAKIHQYIDDNITDLNSAKKFLKELVSHMALMNR